MPIDFLYPEYEVVRNADRCIACRVCERQCANEVHFSDPENKRMMSDESKASTPSVRIAMSHTGPEDRKNRPYI